MAYQNYGNGGYQNKGNSNYGNQGGYQKSNYNPPVKKEVNLEEECNKFAVVYLTLVEQLKMAGVSIEDVKDYLGGWTTSLKLSIDKGM